MLGKSLTGKVAPWLAGLLTLLPSPPTGALEFEIPGERRVQIHGYYEMRLRGFGEDVPANGVTLSQFRHVLTAETDIDIFPDGWGPFDVMVGYTRWLGSYDCIYDKSACGLFHSSDSYGNGNSLWGGNSRPAEREPKSFKTAQTREPYAGGVYPLTYFPGTTLSTVQRITPGHNYRGPINPDGTFWNPNPLAFLANFNTRTVLDQPIDQGAPNSILINTRGGYTNPFGTIADARLISSRPDLVDITGFTFEQLTDRSQFPRLGSVSYGSGLQLFSVNGVANGNLAGALRAEADPNFLARYGLHVPPPNTDPAALRAEAFNLFFPLDPSDPNGVRRLQTIDSLYSSLVQARPDPNKWEPLARAAGGDLLKEEWGSAQRKDTVYPWRSTIDPHVRPTGYFVTDAADTVNEYGAEIANRARLAAQPTVRETVPGLGSGNVSGYCRFIDENASTLACADPQDPTFGNDQNRMIPRFTGPDAVADTVDDLPIGKGSDPNHPIFLTPTDQDRLQLLKSFPIGGGAVQDLIRAVPRDPNDPGPDGRPGTADDPVQLLAPGADGQFGTADDVCHGIGFNANGECILLMASGAGVLDPAVLNALGDLSLRPPTAGSDPTDLTDYVSRSSGVSLPARPSNPQGGLWFATKGWKQVASDIPHMKSNLDIDFQESSLQFDHGASQDEHEFREGYVEFETWDSQIFGRAGKLIWVWGKTELFRNQDRLNPIDIGLGTLASLEEGRIGQWGLQFVFSPEAFMSVGPFEDLRLETVMLVDDFEPTDIGMCGEGQIFEPVCGKIVGAQASGLTGFGLVGEIRPDDEYSGFKRMDYGFRLEGRWDRFTFAVTDFWGWDDGAILDIVHQYQRRVDADTGAPVRVWGPKTCKIRTAEGEGGQSVDVGPNGVAGDGDDQIPSIGNCLLFDNPKDPTAAQVVRMSSKIALDHYANQTLFHTVCTLTFDEDSGYCALDLLNAPSFFPAALEALTNRSIEGISGSAVLGREFIRTPTTRSAGVGTGVTEQIFSTLNITRGDPSKKIGNLDPRTLALLGCGDAFGTGCDLFGAEAFANDPAIQAAFGGTAGVDTPPGGIDFMNAKGDILTQEFTIFKAASPNALIGFRGDKLFEPGITRSVGLTALEADAMGADGDDRPAHYEVSDQIIASQEYALSDFPDGEFALDTMIRPPGSSPDLIPTDFIIEETLWFWDPNARDRREIAFLDPRGADGQFTDPRGPDHVFGTADDLGDPRGPDGIVGTADDAGLADVNPYGENCSALYGGPDPGCTDLEVLSANLERLLITNEIIGNDDVFDPPESFDEVLAVLDGNPDTDFRGDPIAGPDGIFFNDFDSNGDGIRDQKAIDIKSIDEPSVSGNFQLVNAASSCVRQEAFVSGKSICYRRLVRRDDGLRIGALPVGIPVQISSGGGEVETFVKSLINLQQMDPLEIQRILAAAPVVNTFDFSENGFITETDRGVFVDVDTNGDGVRERVAISESIMSTVLTADLDANLIADLDEDKNGTLDFVDDGTAGPITDDNILCGSGVPGDPLQDAIQTEYANSADELLEQEAFPNGLPARSPIFCQGVVGLAGATGQTLPVVHANGSRFGRRDFLWHGGQQVALTYQRRNVAGFSLDFAEDRTKSSWGVEFSWTAGRQFANSNEPDGLSASDEYVLTISVDRPTFFNFLNPNRSFFLNFQFFLRYLSDYHGGEDDRDGNFAAAESALSSFFVFTFFTGYFQDRLSPVFNFVVDPHTGTGAVLSQVSYRWNERFSTAVRMNHFFGHETQARGSVNPVVLYTHPDVTSETLRGLAVVKDRDDLYFTVRYTY